MILKKPYAFFIKQFKLIHIILTIMISYLIYRTGLLLSFLREYMASNQNITGQDLTSHYFNLYIFLVPFLIVISSIIILSVMYVKKKPYIFYIINIVITIIVLAIYGFSYSIIGQMEFKLVDIRTVRLVRDLLMLGFVLQFASVVITIFRATGFDIKKFNFGQDLEQLEITEEDNEEFEVNIAVDTDIIKRKTRRRFRYARYIYIENKFIINIATLLLVATICFVVYLNVGVYNKTYTTNVAFSTKNFNMRVNDVYRTKKDYKGKTITNENNSLLIVSLSLKNKSKVNRKLETVKTIINIDGKKFYPTIKYRDDLVDLGITYQDELITNKEFHTYILTYEIPDKYINKKIIYNYIDDNNYFSANLEAKTIKVKLKYRNLDNSELVGQYNIDNDINLKDSIFKKTNFKINTFEIKNQFQINYQFCPNKDNCYNSIEYLKPDLYNTYDKVLIKINAIINWDDNLRITKSQDIFKFISMYGKIKYQLGDSTKYHNVILKEVKSRRIISNNNYYIEVLSELKDADKISLLLQIRDKQYEYILK